MQRTWVVRPDYEVTTTGAPVPAVSQEALLKAVIDGAVMLHRAGGCLFVQQVRAETGVPGERVTTLAQVEWKDRTDARAQPEQVGELEPLRAVPSPELPADAPVEQDEGIYADAEPDEIAVDESAVPAGLRGS